MTPRRSGAAALASALAVAPLALLACESPIAVEKGLPGASVPARVHLIGARGPYLDATVDDGNRLRRFFFPDSEVCASILRSGREAPVYYNTQGPYGQLVRGDDVCEPVGLLSLVEWRDKRPRDPFAGPVPRSSASYEIVYSDEDVVLAHGRFPLAYLVGWSGGADSIAVLPNTPVCTDLLSKTSATLEFRRSGDQPLVLLKDDERCPVLGFARPLPKR